VSCNLQGFLVADHYNMLCLCEICGSALRIKTSGNKSAARSSTVSSRDQYEIHLKDDFSDANVSLNAWNSKGCVLLFLQIVHQPVIERILSNIVQTVGVIVR